MRGFLSPATNQRTDEYGGTLENRTRLLVEIVAAVRKEIGRGMALGVRICGDELIEHGTTVDDAVRIAEIVEATGHVVVAWIWLDQWLAAYGEQGAFYDGKRAAATYFLTRELPRTGPMLAILRDADGLTESGADEDTSD